jgi:hypothetical protein
VGLKKAMSCVKRALYSLPVWHYTLAHLLRGYFVQISGLHLGSKGRWGTLNNRKSTVHRVSKKRSSKVTINDKIINEEQSNIPSKTETTMLI